jgi:heat shock protein HslJ
MNGPSRLALSIAIAVVGVAAACGPGAEGSPPPSQPPGSLAGTAWRVVSIDGVAPVAGRAPTIAFGPVNVSGSGGCNTYGGPYRYEAGSIQFGDLAMTAMGCIGPIGPMEAAFMKVLSTATSASVDSQAQLVLDGPAGKLILVSDAPPAP